MALCGTSSASPSRSSALCTRTPRNQGVEKKSAYQWPAWTTPTTAGGPRATCCRSGSVSLSSLSRRRSSRAFLQPGNGRRREKDHARHSGAREGDIHVRAPSRDWFLIFYYSSELRTHSFCSRYGTCLACSVNPMPDGWPDMLDILPGQSIASIWRHPHARRTTLEGLRN